MLYLTLLLYGSIILTIIAPDYSFFDFFIALSYFFTWFGTSVLFFSRSGKVENDLKKSKMLSFLLNSAWCPFGGRSVVAQFTDSSPKMLENTWPRGRVGRPPFVSGASGRGLIPIVYLCVGFGVLAFTVVSFCVYGGFALSV